VKIIRASSCPAIEILADPRQIGLAIKAVIKNAIESMPDGGMVTIGTGLEEIDPLFCKTHPHVKPGRHFLLTVSDTGCGIPEEIRKRIFDPFITTKPASPDTGIGLTLALSIINKHFGALDVFSSRGEGTTVTIYIPVAD
jgi:signal transduction histidine kinase